MDAALARTRLDAEVKSLCGLADDWPDVELMRVDGATILLYMWGSGGRKFLLRISCGADYPMDPPSYAFLDPHTGDDAGVECWPEDGNTAFKTDENPPWMCVAGTLEYRQHHPDHRFDPNVHSICQTVAHISRRIK